MDNELQESEYYYETKALVLQYLGLVPGTVTGLHNQPWEPQSPTSSVVAINQSSRSVSDDLSSYDDNSSLRSSFDWRDLNKFDDNDNEAGDMYPRTSSAKSSPQKPLTRHSIVGKKRQSIERKSFPNDYDDSSDVTVEVEPSTSTNDSHIQRGGGLGLENSTSSLNESRFFTPQPHLSSSYSESSFLSAQSDNTLSNDSPSWQSSDNLTSARRRPSREELSFNVQSDGLTRYIQDTSVLMPPRRPHAVSDPPLPSSFMTADRTNLQLNLHNQPTRVTRHVTPEYEMDRGAYLQYLQNEYEEVSRHLTPTGIVSPIAEVLQSPEAEVAKMLDEISREVMKTYGSNIEQATQRIIKESMVQMTYEDFRNAGDSLVTQAPPGIHRISLALCFSRQLAQAILNQGGQSLRNVTDYSVQFVANTAASFIVERGGWSSIADLEFTSGSEQSFPPTPGSPPLNYGLEEDSNVPEFRNRQTDYASLTFGDSTVRSNNEESTVIDDCDKCDVTDQNCTSNNDESDKMPERCDHLNESRRSELSNVSTTDLIEDYQIVMNNYLKWGSAVIGILAIAVSVSFAFLKNR